MPAINDFDDVPQLMYAGEMLPPLREGYALNGAFGSVVTDIKGGMPRIRRDTINNAQAVSVSYLLNDADMVDWFDSWWRVKAHEGSMPIRCMLTLGEAEPKEYVAIVATDPVYSDMRGYYGVVTLNVYAQKVIEDYDYEYSLVTLLEIYGRKGAIEILEYLGLYATVWSTESLAGWGYAR